MRPGAAWAAGMDFASTDLALKPLAILASYGEPEMVNVGEFNCQGA
jgi:hypothetical protein